MIEKVIINTEKSRKKIYQEIDYDVEDSILITSWHLELSNKIMRTFNRKKPLKGKKGVKKEIHSINRTIIWRTLLLHCRS